MARLAVAFRRDFGRRDYCFPARILVRFAAGIAPRFWPPGLLLPGENLGEARGRNRAEILAAGIFASRRESWQDSRQDPGEILAAKNFVSRRDSRREEKSRRPKSRWDPNGIPAEIAAGSRQDPGTYFTREILGTWCTPELEKAVEKGYQITTSMKFGTFLKRRQACLPIMSTLG